MTYEEAREFIKISYQFGSVPGLETIKELLGRLKNPEKDLKVIHIAGTNGKGSTSAFISSILAASGYKVGRYISPAVFSYRERIQIFHKGAGNTDISVEYISKKGVVDAIENIRPICDEMIGEGFHHPTWFEIETAMAFLYMVQEEVDIAVIETGLGGRLDATNVFEKVICAVITSISMDHWRELGDTLDKIAREKAGIIKKDCPVVTTSQETPVRQVISETSKALNSPFYISNADEAYDISHTLNGITFSRNEKGNIQTYKLGLLGGYQVENAMLSIKVMEVINHQGYRILPEQIKEGLRLTSWRGRFEIVSKEPYIVIDGAHNEGAARELKKSIELYFTNRRIIYIMGVLADKDYQSILKYTAPLADMIITVTPDNSRALSSNLLAKEAGKYCKRVLDAGDIGLAAKLAFQAAGKEDVIIAFGSLSYLRDFVDRIKIAITLD
jgi:dihydrofolate synthase/folylpolyglutamate synthase